jgi:hypothetical protein
MIIFSQEFIYENNEYQSGSGIVNMPEQNEHAERCNCAQRPIKIVQTDRYGWA